LKKRNYSFPVLPPQAADRSKSRVSEILSGKRSISKEQAKRLAEFLRVRADLFI
jgi:antitoxin component HigA of HigAB toxin-antitoxin module